MDVSQEVNFGVKQRLSSPKTEVGKKCFWEGGGDTLEPWYYAEQT